MPPINTRWVTGEDLIDNDTVAWANEFGEYLAQNEPKNPQMTTSQIRKFFGEVKRIQADFEKYRDDVPLLSAKLAYAAGRNKDVPRIKEFYKEFDIAIKAINNSKENYHRFVKLLESTVAFHKLHGGKD
ncbi:type III-A CRISPR-associated protein Csm2 [Saprospiraceae bacterium]|nr:type III-A CRISPR-associated protein Csm2 [Saprospiraceae bacterium]HNJ64015.1 type III-A CRISPR-associated protein Csm2 [Saprospiraceae bacterium]